MSYHYPSTEQERRAAALLKKKGWRVDEPACPLCHGFGTVGRAMEWGKNSYSWSSEPCPNGCPTPMMYFGTGTYGST